MAARRTTSSGLSFDIANRQSPVSEGDRIPDVQRLFAGMRFVAGTATSAFVRLVHVYIVQILLAIAKVRQTFGLLHQHELPVMTLKTQIVLLN